MKLSKQEYDSTKESIKEWIVSIDKEEELQSDIKVLNFGLYEPYGIELIGSKEYDEGDDDWACEEDFVPNQRNCLNIKVSSNTEWEDFLKAIVEILKEVTVELMDLNLLKVEHITTGFCDGDLVVVK